MPPNALKILHVSHSLLTGGLERIIVEMVRRGPEYGFVSSVAALKVAGELSAEVTKAGASFHLLHKREGLDFRLVGRLAALVRREGIQLIQAHNVGSGLYAGLAGRLTGRPVVTTRHGMSFGGVSLWLRRAAGLLSSRTVCVGRSIEQLARQKDRLPASRLRVIYNGVDAKEFQPDPQDRLSMRQELGLAPDTAVALAVGRLAGEKDYPGLLRAVAQVEGLTLLVAGQGALMGELRTLRDELGLGGRVRLLGSRQDVPRLLHAADIFVLASFSEGVSKAILEAMACGLPVLATAVGGTPELVGRGDTGLLVPPGHPQELAAGLRSLLKDPQNARAMGENGRERVLARFRLETTLKSYAELYRGLVERRG